MIYSYGFNGQEKDDEISGEGNSYTTLERPYDPRLGRWLKTDPIVASFRSPYVAFDNNPVFYNDPTGATEENPQGQDKSDDATKNAVKPTINIIVMAKSHTGYENKNGTWTVGRAKDPALEVSYNNISKDPNRDQSKFKIIEVDNLNELNGKLEELSKTSNIGNVIFDSHGLPGDAYFNIGGQRIDANGINNNAETKTQLKTLASYLLPDSKVVLLACGAGAPSTGQFMMGSLAKTLGVEVYGNQGITSNKPLYPGTGSTEAFELSSWDDWAYNIFSDGRYTVNPSQANVGLWSVAKPVLNNGKMGVNIKTINSVYIKGDGSIGISIKKWQDYPSKQAELKEIKKTTMGGPGG